MKHIVLRSPVVLYETVEALYQHVNGLSVEGRKRDLLQKFGSKLTRTEREQIEQSCALAAKVAEAACTGLEDGPALETFFRKWETESKWQNTCLAKLMIFSFLDIRTTDLEQSLQRTRQSAEERLNGSYLLRDINSGGISFYAAEPGQTIPPLAEQLDGLMIEEQYRWRLYKLLTNYSAMFDELSALLRPAAQRVQDILPRILPQLQPVYDHWEQYFSCHPFSELLERFTNQSMQLAEMDTYINLSLVAGGDMIYTYDELACSDCRQVYLGVLLHENFRVDRLQMTDDGICSLLKLVADRSKFELLRRCARQPSYCQQLSREMGLTTATISRHMSLLLEAGLVRARKGESRIYYTIDREAVAALCDAVYTTLLPEQLH